MKILAVDQSITCSGWCLFVDGELQNHGIITTKPDKTDPLDAFKRVNYIRDEISELMLGNDILSLEGLSFGSRGDATRKLGGLQFAIVGRAIELGVDVRITPPTTIKKHATGSGRGKKEDVYDALPENIREKFSLYKKTKGRYDLSDAYFIGTFVM